LKRLLIKSITKGHKGLSQNEFLKNINLLSEIENEIRQADGYFDFVLAEAIREQIVKMTLERVVLMNEPTNQLAEIVSADTNCCHLDARKLVYFLEQSRKLENRRCFKLQNLCLFAPIFLK